MKGLCGFCNVSLHGECYLEAPTTRSAPTRPVDVALLGLEPEMSGEPPVPQAEQVKKHRITRFKACSYGVSRTFLLVLHMFFVLGPPNSNAAELIIFRLCCMSNTLFL